MLVQKKNNENKILILDMLNNNFDDINTNLIKENKNLSNINSQINKGVKILSKIKPLDSKETENNYYTENKDEIKANNLKKNLNDDKEMKAFYRLNINNYKLWDIQENSKNSLSHNLSSQNSLIKAILKRLEIENKNKILEEKLKSMELHDCNKRKKIKLKPLKINSYLSHLINKSLSQSKRNILKKKINLDQIKNVKKNNSSDNNDIKPKNVFLENQNTSYYSSIFKNTTVNIIKNKDGESNYENPCYSPSLGRNLWEEFQTIDNEEYDSIERSNMIKEGIKDINKVKIKRHLYLSEKKYKSINQNNNNFKKKNKYILNNIRDLTKLKSISDIERILFKKKKSSALIINDKFKKIK